MQLIAKFFAFLLVLGFAGLFVIKKPDGTAWLSLGQLMPDVQGIKTSVDDVIPSQVLGGSEENVSVYRWQDAEGNWQFSDTPPDHSNAEQIRVNTHLNRDLVPKLHTAPTPAAESKSGKAVFLKDSTNFSPTTVSPDKISELINDAKDVQGLMDNRQQQLDDALQLSR
ncbi:MAG: DUF4124 domain-containing protein [Cellvibrionaceae bacterium]|nr:DUF4124 domain-containing protein [Cellvibrionaceae bacterium]